ncbi:MAG TPA: response regulator [Acidimicrobiaceae bacterium]|nr:response regulator [Acidimicrobiaceae bacterium]
MTVSVLVVDDQLPFRRAARTVVELTPGFEMVGDAASGAEAVEMVAALEPDLVLMDINMDPMNGIEATRRITAAVPATVVVLLSTYDADDLPADARDCGAAAYVHKEEFGPAVLAQVWADHLEHLGTSG